MSTFVIDATTVTFQSTINGSRQSMGDLQELTLGIVLATQAAWLSLQTLVTTMHHIHAPIGGVAVVDVVRGPGEGTLTITGLGTTTAILTALERPTYLPNGKSMATGTFLITGSAI